MQKTKSPKQTGTASDQQARAAGSSYRERLLRVNDMCVVLGRSRSAFYLLAKQAGFPKPVRPHGAALAWRESEVVEWIAALPVVAVSESERTGTARGAA